MAFLGFSPLELRTYLILSLCWLSIVQVNLLEQPYARSLVRCDTPTNSTPGAEFSGSNYCGDRLYVINQGASLSGKGQSLEAFGRILITFVVSSYADNGRRNAAILGQALLVSSTLLFFLAGFVPSFAVPIYVLAQGLQGMSGIGILDQIVTGDVALQSGDSVGVYNRKNTFGAVMMVLLSPPVLMVQMMEITDFTYVWLGVNLLNFLALGLLISVFPETLPEEQKRSETGIAEIAVRELQSFRDHITENWFLLKRLLEQTAIGLSDPASIMLPFLMANFGISQFNALILGFVPGIVMSPLFMPLAPALIKRFGYVNGWATCYVYLRIMAFLPLFGLPFMPYPLLATFWGLPGIILSGFLQLPLVGWGSIVSAVEIRIVGQAANAKFQAMMQLVGHFTGCVSSYVFARLFDAQAETPDGKMLPFYYAAVWSLLQAPYYFCIVWPRVRQELEKMQQEEAVEAKEEPVGDKKTD